MDTYIPDFTLVEQTFERRLLEQGLPSSRLEKGVATGIEGLELYRAHCEVLELQPDDHSPAPYFASLEIRAALHQVSGGAVNILDLVTVQAETAEQAIVHCAETFMDVTFPALRSLLRGTDSDESEPIKLSSYTPALGRALAWEVFTGNVQLLNDKQGSLGKALEQQPPIALVLNTLSGFLATPSLHWCKVYGANARGVELVFGCAIDGAKSLEAEAEMHSKFPKSNQVPGAWEFRQFFVMRPSGETDATTAEGLKQKAQELLPRRRRWWPWSRH